MKTYSAYKATDMIIKYKALTDCGKIEQIEVERETDNYVLVSGYGTTLKVSDDLGFFDTFEQARLFILRKNKERLDKLTIALDRIKNRIEEAHIMVEE